MGEALVRRYRERFQALLEQIGRRRRVRLALRRQSEAAAGSAAELVGAHQANHPIAADAVAKELIPHVQTLLDAIDAAVAGRPDFQSRLGDAAEHMTMTAAVLTSGIVADKKITQ